MTALCLGMLLLLSNVGFSQSFVNSTCNAAGSILSVKNTTSGKYEYVTFRVKKPLQANYGYSITTVSGSTFVEDPSGDTITVTGSRFKKIRFRGVYWTCQINEILSLPKFIIKDIKRIKQYEGIVEYVVGYRNPPAKFLGSYSVNSSTVRSVVMVFRRY
jgi:hypothetical protein